MSEKTKPKKAEQVADVLYKAVTMAEPSLTSKELEVSLLILAELRLIRDQLKTEVVTRDKFR